MKKLYVSFVLLFPFQSILFSNPVSACASMVTQSGNLQSIVSSPAVFTHPYVSGLI